MPYFVDSEGETFRMNGEFAHYLTYKCPMPRSYRPATMKEEKSYCESHAMTWAIVYANLPLCYHILKTMHWRGDYDEIVCDVGIPTLFKCACTYDSNQAAFSTFATRALQRAFIRKMNTKSLTLFAFIQQSYEDTGIEERDLVQYLFRRLEPREVDLLYQYFWKGATYEEIGIMIGRSGTTVSSYIKEALNKCRTFLED